MPFQSAPGTKRTAVLALAASSSALASAGALPPLTNASQVLPSVLYCQMPLALFTPVTAKPLTAPASASLTRPEISADTRVPGLTDASSAIVARLLAPDSSGALLVVGTVLVVGAETTKLL